MEYGLGVLLLLSLLQGGATVDWDVETDLDRYVQTPDDVFSWEQINYWDHKESYGCDVYLMNFTSQTWMTPEFSSRSIWWHYLLIALPVNFTHQDAGLVYIDGGHNTGSPPDEDDTMFNLPCAFAASTGSVGSLLTLIPNQPIQFYSDPTNRSRTEDAIIAHTWRMFIDDIEGPTERILQFPMTKGGIRAMDVVNQFTKTQYPESDVARFIVSGGSKRGWASWLIACTDRRVEMVAPLVLSCLNTEENLMHHYQSLGGWSAVMIDYYEEEIFKEFDTPEFDLLMQHVDPYSYLERLTIPKIVVSATGDEFFLPDDSHYFFDALPEPKYMLMCENNNHGLGLAYQRVLRGLIAFFTSHLESYPLPNIWWQLQEDAISGSVTLHCQEEPTFVEAWMADTILSPKSVWRRDFRFTTYENGTGEHQPVYWRPYNVTEEGGHVYKIEFDKREGEGWRGFFINAMFPSGNVDMDIDISTEVNIIPDIFPFPPCEGQECQDAPLL